jgi:hypothetical protein
VIVQAAEATKCDADRLMRNNLTSIARLPNVTGKFESSAVFLPIPVVAKIAEALADPWMSDSP